MALESILMTKEGQDSGPQVGEPGKPNSAPTRQFLPIEVEVVPPTRQKLPTAISPKKPEWQFKKGASGNPGGGAISKKVRYQFGDYLRTWLQQKGLVLDKEGNPTKIRQLRIKTIVERLAFTKPEVILYYAYGKPIETTEISASPGTTVEFSVKVGGEEIP